MTTYRYQDFSPTERKIIYELKQHAQLGKKLTQHFPLSADHEAWIERGDKLVKALDPYGPDFDRHAAWGTWWGKKTWIKGEYPANEKEKCAVFVNAVNALEEISQSPAIALRHNNRSLKTTEIVSINEELLLKIRDDDTTFHQLGKSLRRVFLRLKLFRNESRYDPQSLLETEEVARLLHEGKQLSLKLFALSLEKSVLKTLLYKCGARNKLFSDVSFQETEIQILKFAGLDEKDISDFLYFIHNECEEELELLIRIGLENTKTSLQETPIPKSKPSTTWLTVLASWIQIVGGASITAWNLSLLSGINPTIIEQTALLAKLLAALTLIGKGVHGLHDKSNKEDKTE